MDKIEQQLNRSESILIRNTQRELDKAETIFKKPKIGDFVKIKRNSGKIEDNWKIIDIDGENVVVAKK